MVAITTALKKIAATLKKIVIVQGGARAGKTYAILLLIIDYASNNKNKRIGIFSFSYPHLQRGAIYDFVNIMRELGIYDENRHNKTEHKYYFESGSVIEFITADEAGKIQGTQFDITFVNEARLVNFETFNQILLRSKNHCFIDFNPTTKFYAHDLLQRKDAEFLKLTYVDNEACPQGIIDELENIKELAKTSTYWANYCKVYVYGEIGGSIDAVFPDWKISQELPEQAKLISLGVDFGFTNDVTAIVAIYYADNAYYLRELEYKTMLSTKDIAGIIADFKCPIYCDNAEPRLITELNTLLHTNRCKPVKYSISDSIDRINREKIFILSNSINVMNEQMNYVYVRDKYSGQLTNTPIGTNNHAMDAIRYGLMGYFENKKFGIYQKDF